MLEKFLIDYCSPTLASIKTGSIFTVNSCGYDELAAEIEYWNRKLSSKNISITMLRFFGESALVYVYRKSQLQKELNRKDVAKFLRRHDYKSTDLNYVIAVLKRKCHCSSSFPHEIGVFLGYPLDDVKGFIKNAGKNCKCAGCWKVYCNECEAVKTFAKFKKCKSVYNRLWCEGRSIVQLTVAA